MKHQLRLFIGGINPYSDKIRKNLKEILDRKIKGEYELKIYDIIASPKAAEENHIIGTPVLEKVDSSESKRITGEDVIDEKKLSSFLDIN